MLLESAVGASPGCSQHPCRSGGGGPTPTLLRVAVRPIRSVQSQNAPCEAQHGSIIGLGAAAGFWAGCYAAGTRRRWKRLHSTKRQRQRVVCWRVITSADIDAAPRDVLQTAEEFLAKQKHVRVQQRKQHEMQRRVMEGEEADARAVDHARRVATAAAVDCPGVSIYVGRARGLDKGGHVKPLFRQDLGYADLETKRKMTPDTIFRLYDLSKPIIAASIMPLVHRGLVSLHEPLSKYLPDFDRHKLRVWKPGGARGGRVASRRSICLEDVLRHTSGFYYPADSETGAAGIREPALCREFREVDPHGAATLEEFCERLSSLPLCCEPGQAFVYSPGPAVMARVAEVVSGLPYEKYLQEVLLGPLGMNSTGFVLDRAQRQRLATVYRREQGPRGEIGEPTFRALEDQRPGPNLATDHDGGLFSTVDDYATFVRWLLSDGYGLIPRELLRSFEKDRLVRCGPGTEIPADFLGFSSSFNLGMYIHKNRLCGWSGLGNLHFCCNMQSGRYTILMAQVVPFSWHYQQLLTLRAREVLQNGPNRRRSRAYSRDLPA
eukprot:TRINITY_DN44760_c0_g1_i1.p1 TRINITY_DN44760_c0_g1~~TRINITY_DN44760_c0_g1_i1.p1  ORF type:complete len:549 (+),score=86.84 TRINITY_DN44760_c0_g1_i1:104-1750(+)